jgi:NADH:ubiquinone oxidoreductase subunit 5 (subunit L)/multisubunit Na+/H+ antiporter MnhA subunit
MPITGFTCAAAALSTAGVPPLAGFWSKLLIIVALWTSGHYNYAVIAVLASIITLAYMLVVQRKIFFGKFNEKLSGLTEASWQISLPAIILALMTILIGLLFPFVLCRLITY